MILVVRTCRILQLHFLMPSAKIRELRKESGYNDPTLMMIVKDEAGQTVLSLPFFPGH